MNKRAIGISVVILVVLAAAWGVMASRKKGGLEKGINEPAGKQEQADTGKLTSLKELQAMASPQKCTFKDEASQEQVQGLVYIGKGKMRGDFGMFSQGKTIKSHMISDGKYSYTWMDDSATGFKVAVDAPKTESKPASSGVDADKQFNYFCQAWSEDSSMFTVPSNVDFQDMSSLVAPLPPQNGGVQPAGSSAAACAACDSLQGDAKTQCRTALSCK